MTRLVIIIIGSIMLFSCTPGQIQPESNKEMVAMLKRLAPDYENRFLFIEQKNDSDYFELTSKRNKIVVKGNSVNSLAVGLNYYLRYYCNTSISWYMSDPVQLPQELPMVEGVVRKSARLGKRFFLNYCTFGYSMPWWKWSDWERLIDWMALNGINMPLAITGEEAIWQKVWQSFGIKDSVIRNYFTGPAYLPWHRMSNLDHWGGPLPQSWIDGQLELQKKILKRERAMGMTPVLPAFSGHVPKALKEIEPDAKIDKLGFWGGFPDQYRCYFLNPLDPLFPKIQKAFLEEQTRQFGSDHLYGADPFNEVEPPSWDPDFLASVAKTIYHSMSQVDPEANWIQMSWIFYFERKHWTNERIKAMIDAVPAGKMTLLDYYGENTEVWPMTESFFGKPYIWCYLGNFGGNTMLAGNLAETGIRIENTFKKGGAGFTGIGSTLEGLDVNPLMYEFIFDHVWRSDIDPVQWIDNWADRRYGNKNDDVRAAWNILLQKVYGSPAHLGQGTLTNARPSFTGSGNWTTDPNISYDNRELMKAWGLMLKAPVSNRKSYAYDVVNIGRQVLGNHFLKLRDEFTSLYNDKKLDSLKIKGNEMLQLLDDLDRLLQTEPSFLLGKWIENAQEMGENAKEKDYFENDSRNILTTWGEKGQSLNDYANRSWAGLTKSYYSKRWEMFIQAAVASLKENRAFNEDHFYDDVTKFEWNWIKSAEQFPAKPTGDPFRIANELYAKYNY